MRYLPLAVIVCMLACMPAFGASSFLGGQSGDILTPDGLVTPQGSWDLSYHQFTNLLVDTDLTTFGVVFGVAEGLEIGASFLNNGGSETAVNAKFRLMAETPQRPAILVGVFDAASTFSNDSGLYLVISKNITSTASDIAGEPSKPLRLNVGFGSGLYDGIFLGLDWTLQPQLSLMAEFSSGQIGDNDSFFNAGIRYAVSDAFRLDLATIDLEEIAFGASYRFDMK